MSQTSPQRRGRGKKRTFSDRSPQFIRLWHPERNGDLKPDGVSATSQTVVWWLNSDCGHEWQSTVAVRTLSKNMCGVCSGKKTHVGTNDLATVAPDIAATWHPTKNLPLTPQTVTKGSQRKVWWRDPDCGHEWEARIVNHVRWPGCSVCHTVGKTKKSDGANGTS